MSDAKEIKKLIFDASEEDTVTFSENESFSSSVRMPGAPRNRKAAGVPALPEHFRGVTRYIMRDLNNDRNTPTFYKYTKSEISDYLKNPFTYEQQLRDAVIYLYSASPHFKRIVQYFTSLSDLSYVVVPHKLDTSSAQPEKVRKNFTKTLNLLAGMNIKVQCETIIRVCMREDVYYCTIIEGSDSVILQQLPSEFCRVAVIEDGVMNVSFNFQYFDSRKQLLPFFPPEFTTKYNIYQRDTTNMKWQELDPATSFAIKANDDIPGYAVPPLAGIFREIYDLEDYRELKLTKTELENYAMIVMQLPLNPDGTYQLPYQRAKDFYQNLDGVLPEEIGSVLSPMEVRKISFERTHTGDTDTIAESEQNLFTAAGVSSLLFNNEKASANALTLSIKADQAITYSIVKKIETALNRFLHKHGYAKNFKMTFLDCSPFNRKELGDEYLKACQYGIPMVSYYCASQGLLQSDMDGMNFLEDTVLGVKKKFVPLKSTSTMSSSPASPSDENSPTDGEAGRPQADISDLTEAGEQTREAGEE